MYWPVNSIVGNSGRMKIMFTMKTTRHRLKPRYSARMRNVSQEHYLYSVTVDLFMLQGNYHL